MPSCYSERRVCSRGHWRDLKGTTKMAEGKNNRKPPRRFGPPSRPPAAFTLIELLVSTVIFILILGLVIAIMSSASSLWLRHRNQSVAFESANAAFETLTRTLGQAVLNTYWEVKNNSYGRSSELHFTMGPTVDLLGSGSSQEFPGEAVFFQAILGRPTDSSLRRLPLLVNGVGYFVHFDDGPANPAFLDSVVTPRHRFRLYEWLQPTEQLEVYGDTSGKSWFRNSLSAGVMANSNVLAENVIGLVLLAEYPDANGTIIPSYLYDSRDDTTPQSLHQLPPRIRVTMVVIDESSAIRLAEKYSAAAPPIQPDATWFQDPQEFGADLDLWENRLKSASPKINYRIFTATVIIQNAKWSVNP